MNNPALTNVDHTAIKTNQAVIISLNLVGFLLDLPILAFLVTTAMLIGAILRRPGFGFIYQYFLKPAGLTKPDVILDNKEPHLFAQGFGGVVMLAGSIFLAAGNATLGWGFVWVVIILASINLFGGLCMGCFVYYWLNRLNFPGFSKEVPENTTPGFKPGRKP